jgi:hypothetical protein
MQIEFTDLPDDARIWTFGVQRPLSPEEEQGFLEAVDGFLDTWAAHGTPLRGARRWHHGRMLVVGVDESAAPPSGCSIDALVHSLKDLEQRLDTRIVDNAPVWYLRDGEVSAVSRKEFRQRAESEEVDRDTVVFDPTLTRMAEYRAGQWEGPAANSWHGRAFFGL